MKHQAVVLLSGGLDSTVTLACALRENQRVIPLHARYGQRTDSREAKAFQAICDHYGLAERFVVSLDHLAVFGGSALTDPALTIPTTGPQPGIPITYVPFRNGNLLALAASLAESRGADRLYIGAVDEDSSGYPDCRPEFFRAFETAVNIGTRPETRLEIRLPVIHRSKGEIVRLGQELNAPLALSWSCYSGVEKACGICESCRLRLKGFREAGIPDPIPYEPVDVMTMDSFPSTV